ncbi:MAG: hypothetical protein ACJAWZ_003121, partial [Paracoccaceae bacterium]
PPKGAAMQGIDQGDTTCVRDPAAFGPGPARGTRDRERA